MSAHHLRRCGENDSPGFGGGSRDNGLCRRDPGRARGRTRHAQCFTLDLRGFRTYRWKTRRVFKITHPVRPRELGGLERCDGVQPVPVAKDEWRAFRDAAAFFAASRLPRSSAVTSHSSNSSEENSCAAPCSLRSAGLIASGRAMFQHSIPKLTAFSTYSLLPSDLLINGWTNSIIC